MAPNLCFFLSLLFLPTLIAAISYCGESCQTLNDCWGQLICISGKCNDDRDVGTHICSSPSPPPPPVRSPPPPIRSPPPPIRSPPPPPPAATSSGCSQSGTLTCNTGIYPTYTCSPPVTGSTRAILTNNDFSAGADGGAASECDEQFHQNSEFVVALSTGWYAGGTKCGRMIQINANGRTTTAKVVDECDSRNGCDVEHAYQPPCRNNIVDASNAVWNALGLNIDVGEVDITWSMV